MERVGLYGQRGGEGSELGIVQAFYPHTEKCGGAWTPDGKMLATVSEDGSLCVWDVFGEASAAGISGEGGGQR
jgi:ribosome assembly protein SQT1